MTEIGTVRVSSTPGETHLLLTLFLAAELSSLEPDPR